METAITINSIIGVAGILVAITAGLGALLTLYRYIVDNHDRTQRWDEQDKEIKAIKAEQCMLTYCMMATLDGLSQLGANGKVTEARQALDKYMNKQAHGVNQ